MHRIEAGLLIPGHGDPVSDGVVVLDGPSIGYAGPAGLAPPTPGAPVTRVTAVMPGMWECHGHLLGTRTFDLGQLPLEPEALRAARCARDLRAALDAGVTSVRDVGGLGLYLARAVDEGVIDGPAIYGAGAILSTTGGHGDLHSFPLAWMRDYSAHGGMMRLADGPDECATGGPRAAQAEREGDQGMRVRRGAVRGRRPDPPAVHGAPSCARSSRSRGWPTGWSRRTATASRASWPRCEAGVRTIEHGTYLDDECCDAMRETAAILVPTRTIIEDMLAFRDAVPPYAMAKLGRDRRPARRRRSPRAHEHGVTIAMGTDIALTGLELPNAWGQNGSEPGYLVKLGMSPRDAIEAATASGPLTLGPQAPRSGRLAAGYDADVITLDADPLADIGVLGDPDRITAVWTRGRQVKGAVAT